MRNAAVPQHGKTIVKRGLCLFLCLLMFVTLLPVKAYAATTKPAKVTQAQAKKRVAQLQSALNGKYFTVNQKSCNSSFENYHGCKNCGNYNLIKTDWLKKAVSLVPSSITNCPESYYAKTGGATAKGQSCSGFSTFASWYIFAQKSSDKVKNEHIITTTYNKSNLSKALPGDLILFGRSSDKDSWFHAAIFVEATSTGARVLQCNGDTSKGNCYVSTNVIKFGGSKYKYFSISRATNYDTKTTEHTHTAGTTWQYDTENHWKLCTGNDNYVMNKAAHSLNTVVEQQGGLYQCKKSHSECATCGYRTETVYSGFQYYKGDLNYDGKVDVIDVAGLYEHLAQGKKLPACQNKDLLEDNTMYFWWNQMTANLSGGADLNGDGATDIYDLQLLYEIASTQKLTIVTM